ncbi:hypothetical protein KRMM14A1259_51550 [Krasilnikovia sp. MM14-A1259]
MSAVMVRLAAYATARRRVRGAAAELDSGDAAALGFPSEDRVAAFTCDLTVRGARRALLHAHRGWLAAYALVGVVVVGLGPVVPALVAAAGDSLRQGGIGVPLAAGAIGAVLAAAAARWLSTWLARALVYQMTHLVKLAVFTRLQTVRPAWLTAHGRSASTYLITAPMQLAQLAFVGQFGVNTVLIAVLAGYLVVVFGAAGVVVTLATAALVALWRRLVAGHAGRMHHYLEHGHQRIALIDAITRHWQAIGRQRWHAPVVAATDRARDGQLRALRTASRAGGVLGAVGGGMAPLACLLALFAHGWLGGGPGGGLALLLVVQMLVTAIKDNMDTYGSVAWAATLTRDVETLFREAPTAGAALLGAAPGMVRLGPRVLPPGSRVVLLGAGARRTFDALSGAAGPVPGLAAVAGVAVTVARGEPELDGTVAANLTLWTPPQPDRYADAAARAALRDALAARESADAAVLATGQRRLSDGESVRLGLARAWYHAPAVLLLDDTFAAPDPPVAAAVAARLSGGTRGEPRQPSTDPTVIYVGTREDPGRWATHVALCGDEEPAVFDVAEATLEALATVLPPAEAARWWAALVAAAPGGAAPAAGSPSPSASPEPAPEPETEQVLAGVGVERDIAAPGLWTAAGHLVGLYSGRGLAFLVALVAALVGVDLATAGTLGHPGGGVVAVLGLAVAAATLSGVYELAVVRGALPATRSLHRRIVDRILHRGLPSGSATAAGRLSEDFTTAELWSPGILVGGVQATIATLASVVAMAMSAPVVIVGVAMLGGLAAAVYPRLRRDSVRGRALLAATRGPIRTFGGAVIGCPSFTLSPGLRPAFARRYRDLLAVEHVALYAAHGARMAIVGAAEAAGVLLFAATLAAAAVAPAGSAVLITVAVYAAYAIGERLAALVEAHQEVDGTAQVLGRVADLLGARTLPRLTRSGPSDRGSAPATGESGRDRDLAAPAPGSAAAENGRDAPAARRPAEGDPAPTAVGLRAQRLVTAVPGRAAAPVSLTVGRGELAAVRGGSGAGKSVLLRTLAGFDPPADGSVTLAGRDPARLVENEPPPLPIPVGQLCTPAASALADAWCAALGLPPLPRDAQVAALDRPRRQVLALAAACAADPAVLLIDETTSALTPAAERTLLGLVRARLPEAAIVAVLHRPDNLDLADREVQVGQSRGTT